MKIAVIDGQGAGLGKTFIKECKRAFKNDLYIFALGTNEIATLNMLKSGADEGFTGEADIIDFFIKYKIDAIVGPIGILIDGGIGGEITPNISKAIFKLDCTKYIIPLQKHGIFIPGTRNLAIKDIIKEIIEDIRFNLTNKKIY